MHDIRAWERGYGILVPYIMMSHVCMVIGEAISTIASIQTDTQYRSPPAVHVVDTHYMT